MEMNMLGPFVLDKDSILERLGGDEEIFAMMVDMFLQDIDSNCAALAAALASGDAVRLRREAHTVKGLLATFSDDAGAEAALAIELQAKLGEVDAQADAVKELERRLREVAAVLGTG